MAITAAPPRACPHPQQTAALNGSTLKLYVDSTSLALVHQMADFVACAEQRDVAKVMTWLRLPLSARDLAPYAAAYCPQLAAVSPGFVAMVADTVRRERYSRVELHANQYHAARGTLPLLQALAPLIETLGCRLVLHLYDDGNVGLLQRESLKAEPDPAAALHAAAYQLRRAVYDRQPLQWRNAHGYAWHHLFETRYHLLRSDILLRDAAGSALHACLSPAIVEMRFDGLPQLNEDQQIRYLTLFGLNAEIGNRLEAVAGRGDVLLFTASAVWDKSDNSQLRDSQLRAIAELRRQGLIDRRHTLCFKGHPANGDHDAELIDALGEHVVELPRRVPLEVLMMAGLLPGQVGGAASSSFCSLDPDRIAFMLCRRSALHGGRGGQLLRLMLDCAMVDASRVRAWL